jgi:hypothetical protein
VGLRVRVGPDAGGGGFLPAVVGLWGRGLAACLKGGVELLVMAGPAVVFSLAGCDDLHVLRFAGLDLSDLAAQVFDAGGVASVGLAGYVVPVPLTVFRDGELGVGVEKSVEFLSVGDPLAWSLGGDAKAPLCEDVFELVDPVGDLLFVADAALGGGRGGLAGEEMRHLGVEPVELTVVAPIERFDVLEGFFHADQAGLGVGGLAAKPGQADIGEAGGGALQGAQVELGSGLFGLVGQPGVAGSPFLAAAVSFFGLEDRLGEPLGLLVSLSGAVYVTGLAGQPFRGPSLSQLDVKVVELFGDCRWGGCFGFAGLVDERF